jgi:hypothetical protein
MRDYRVKMNFVSLIGDGILALVIHGPSLERRRQRVNTSKGAEGAPVLFRAFVSV